MLDSERRRLKAVVGLIFWWALMAIVLMLAVQFVLREYMTLPNAIIGVGVLLFAVNVAWKRGGKVMDTIMVVYIFADGSNKVTAFNRALARAMIGFFAIWSLIAVFLCIVPLYANALGFGLVLVAVPSFFILRHMAGMTINWMRWVWVSGGVLAFGGVLCIFSALKPIVAGWFA